MRNVDLEPCKEHAHIPAIQYLHLPTVLADTKVASFEPSDPTSSPQAQQRQGPGVAQKSNKSQQLHHFSVVIASLIFLYKFGSMNFQVLM